MNCKPGDLAILVGGVRPDCIGKLVHVLCWERKGRGWEVKLLFKRPMLRGKKYFWAADSSLRPIRDNDGEDETITWAGKPQQVIA